MGSQGPNCVGLTHSDHLSQGPQGLPARCPSSAPLSPRDQESERRKTRLTHLNARLEDYQISDADAEWQTVEKCDLHESEV